MMDARSIILYEVYPQLDALGVDGVARLLGSFSGIEDEAERDTNAAFQAYGAMPGEGDMGDLAESARDEGIEYYRTLVELRQGVTNLLAVGLYHLYEQHRRRVNEALAASGSTPPEVEQFPSWRTVDELRLVCNAVKHADGPSAKDLRKVRPDLFDHPIVRAGFLGRPRTSAPRRLVNPMGGTDLFLSRDDLTVYRDALRDFWETFLQYS